MSEKLELDQITKRAISGVVAFVLSTTFLQPFSFFAVFVLTILLEPQILGIFFVVSAILNILIYFSDIGLAAALIQKKEEPTRVDLVSAFTMQQLIIFTIVILGLLFSEKIAHFYGLDSQGLMLLRVLIFSLILSSLKTIPSILLQRKLKFVRFIIPQIGENIAFYTIAIILAFLGFGISSFTWAVLARGIVGLYLIYALSPWMPALGISRTSAQNLTSFGFPFQLNSILALIKDDLLTVFLGKILPFTQVGYIGWAQKFAFLPLRFFMDSVNKVTFPAYSRLQEHTKELGHAIEKSLFFVTYFVYPSIFGLLAIAPTLIEIIPRYQKWEPALPLLYLFAINTVFSAISTTFTNALFATGRPGIVLKFMVFWTGATWLLTYPLVARFSYLGVALASAIVAVTSLSTIYFVKKQIPVSVGKSIFGPLFISIVMFFSMREIANVIAGNIAGLVLTIMAGAIIYFAASIAIFRKHLIEDAMTIVRAIIFKE